MNLRKLLLTKNECYIIGTKVKPCGVMVHSTGANNPNLKRYVGPDDGLLGVNQNGNHWNQFRPGGRQVCVHAFIGKLADGSIATYQTLPWDMKGWHAGGNANGMGYIGFEICEDGLTDPAYFAKVYREAVELTAYLCKEYGLDPLKDGVVICHQEGYRRGIASNHGDVLHWFPKMGKTMDNFRRDVADTMKEDDDDMMDQEKFNQMFNTAMQQYRQSLRDNDSGAWSAEARKYAVDQGIFVGSGTAPDGTPNFMWEDFLTREQCAQVLYRFAQKNGLV